MGLVLGAFWNSHETVSFWSGDLLMTWAIRRDVWSFAAA
jgi:hypothetical protein